MIKWYLVVYEEIYSFVGVDINSLPYSEYFANSETHLTYYDLPTKVEQFAKSKLQHNSNNDIQQTY